MAKVYKTPVEIVPDYEAIRNVVTTLGSFVGWLGAGPSREAGIKTGGEICQELRAEMENAVRPPDPAAWADDELNWSDMKRRYSTVLQRARPTPAMRVEYFRGIVRGVQPSFSHHALSLLMNSGVLKRTCLTTNFDKLIEMAHSLQGDSDFQAIRGDDEVEFWRELEDKNFIIKLHGDYDTHNILNTMEETLRIPRRLQKITGELLQQAGLIVLGSSGYEESVMYMLNDLIAGENDDRILNRGIYWGVNVGIEPQDRPSLEEIEKLVLDKLRAGSVSREVIEFMARAQNRNRRAAFFPAWGAAGFLLNLVKATENKAVIGRACHYLDHSMRLRQIFSAGKLDEAAITTRLAKLEAHASRRQLRDVLLKRSAQWETVLSAVNKDSATEITAIYGDITSRSLMNSDRFPRGRRAVLSSDDNFLSAGGGVSLALADKAGKQGMLNELSKLSPIDLYEVAITSGGDLPVSYVLHAAATEIRKDGTSHISPFCIGETFANALESAKFLSLRLIFTPLLGTGTEEMPVTDSLDAFLGALSRFAAANPAYPLTLALVIREEKTLGRSEMRSCLERTLGPSWTLTFAK
jgi:O-acetyl-ADP-ribose deacetylase (regulator of RNase III)